MVFIGFGGWISYYYFLIGSTITKILKEDIFGFGKSFQILNDLIISKHKFLILFISYFSEFFFGLIICLYLIYSEKAHIKKKNKYEKMKNDVVTNERNIKKIIKRKKNKIPKKELKLISNLKSKSKEIENENENNKENNNKESNNENYNDISTNEINKNLINDDDNFSNKGKLIVEKKIDEIDHEKNEVDNNSQTIPKNYELIHNDIYEDIIESSLLPILLSSFLLIINDVVIKWIFSKNEIFDYFFLNILIMTLIFKYHFKEKIYSHQTLALLIILFIAGALFVACLFENIDFSDENKTVWEAFDEKHYMVFIFIIIYLASSTCSCYGTIIQKRIMDYQFASPYKIIFFRGLLGMFISTILIIISTNIPCKENHIVIFKLINKNNYNNSIINNNSNNISNNIYFYDNNILNSNSSVNTSAPPLFECIDSYNNNTYFDNVFSYFYSIKHLNNKKDKYLELLLSIPIYCILHFLSNILFIFVNKLLSPIHCLIVDSLYRLLHIPIQTLQNINIDDNSEGFFYEYIIQPLSTRILRVFAHFISIIGYCIYLEIIELKFCGLNNNIRKNIKIRAKSDGKATEYISNYSMSSSNITSDEEDEEERGSIQNNLKTSILI